MDARKWLQFAGLKLGTILTIDNPVIIEIASQVGFDWLWIDAEHGRFNELSAAAACALSAERIPIFVRLPDHSPTTIKRFLDAGSDGIILPQVSSVEDVHQIARAALYPPLGERSVGISRAQGYGARFAECLQSQTYAIMVQIETAAGIQNGDGIIGHAAVDAVMIGPYDLSGSFGIPGQIDAPQVLDGIATVQQLCRKHGKPCGIFAATAQQASAFAQSGFELVAAGIDCSILLNAFTTLGDAIRQGTIPAKRSR